MTDGRNTEGVTQDDTSMRRSRRAGRGRHRCQRVDLFVDGVKVPVGPGGADILHLDSGVVRKVHPASLRRITRTRGKIDVLVVPHGGQAVPGWFDQLPPGLPIWRGTVDGDAASASSRRRTRSVQTWDDRNLLVCARFIQQHPDPAIPEHSLLATAALAAAETELVSFVRRRTNLEAIVRAGERSARIHSDLAPVRTILHGTEQHPLPPTDDRHTLRRRAGRLLNRSEAAAGRLERFTILDRRGAPLTVAAALASLDMNSAEKAATALTAVGLTAGAATLAGGPEAGTWAWRTLATLTVFTRLNSLTYDLNPEPDRRRSGRRTAEGRQARHRRVEEGLSVDGIADAAGDAIGSAVRAARQAEGGAGRKAAAAATAAAGRLREDLTETGSATVQLTRSRRLSELARNLTFAATTVAAHAAAAAEAGAGLNSFETEIISGATIGAAAAAAGSTTEPGRRLKNEAVRTRREWDRTRRRLTRREAEKAAYSIIEAAGRNRPA